jgi:predicted aminopeptidase
MRREKQQRLQRLADELRAELAGSGLDSPGWLGGELNNARLVSIGLYELDLARFRELYEDCERDLACFYERAEELQQQGAPGLE